MTQVYEHLHTPFQLAAGGSQKLGARRGEILPKRKQAVVRGSNSQSADLPLDTSLFAAGDRVCVAVSGGADSTALLRGLLSRRAELGIVLSVLHVEHGLRGVAAGRDAAFVVALAKTFNLPCEVVSVDTPKRVEEQKESIEEAARNLRYSVFREMAASGRIDKIATAHTLDDQAETVLMKLLRGAWTEGLSGIHPVLQLDDSGHACVRPLLATARAEVEAYLRRLGQPWREDETNVSDAYTRNRIRHELLPAMRQYNPRVGYAFAHLAANARAEEQHWEAELARLLPQLLLPGKPVRGGGRGVPAGAVLTGVEIARLRTLDSGLLRRVLRAIAQYCGATLDFEATERLLGMIEMKSFGHSSGSAKRLELPGGVVVKRTARELQFERHSTNRSSEAHAPPIQYELPVPGTVEAPAFGARYSAIFANGAAETAVSGDLSACPPPAYVRPWQAGDRVELAYSSGPKKVKEVLERMGIHGEERVLWPVVVWRGQIVWMRGVRVSAGHGPAGTASVRAMVPTICETRQ